MLKENWRFISRIERLADALMVVVAFFVTYYSRGSLLFWNRLFGFQIPFVGPKLAPLKDYFIVLIIALGAYGITLQLQGAYSSMRLSSSIRLLRISIVSSVITFIVLSAALFLLKLDLSRSFIGLFCIMIALSLAAQRFIILEILRYWRRRGRNFRNIIICGTGTQALKLAKEIYARPALGINIRAFAYLPTDDDKVNGLAQFKSRLIPIAKAKPFHIIEGVQSVEQALKDHAIDEVIFTDVVQVMPEVENLVQSAAEQGVHATIAADLFSLGLVQSGLSYFGSIPLIHFQTPPGDRWELSLKRIIDIFISLSLIVALIPVFFTICVGIIITMGRPLIFVQKRVGLNGRLFDLYKFRSMNTNAEAELSKLLELNEMNGPVFKMKDDPRVTTFGRFLRKHSLDELPQLWNVLRGDMSLVGPRPPVPGEVSLYERKDRRRLSMRPGMTCTWQVSGRNEIPDFEEWVRLDLEYIDNWSLALDLLLLFKTLPVVLFGSGAR